MPIEALGSMEEEQRSKTQKRKGASESVVGRRGVEEHIEGGIRKAKALVDHYCSSRCGRGDSRQPTKRSNPVEKEGRELIRLAV